MTSRLVTRGFVPTMLSSCACLLSAIVCEFDSDLCHFDVDKIFVQSPPGEDIFLHELAQRLWQSFCQPSSTQQEFVQSEASLPYEVGSSNDAS